MKRKLSIHNESLIRKKNNLKSQFFFDGELKYDIVSMFTIDSAKLLSFETKIQLSH
jgi:hypothetical protein